MATTNLATATQAVTFNGFKSIEDKEFYERALIQPSRDEHILDQFTEKKTLPSKHGKTISFRKPARIKPLMSPLLEGVLPEPNEFAMYDYSTSVQNYGDHILFSDESQDYSIDNMKAILTTEMGYAFKDFMEQKRYELFKSSPNRWFAGVVTIPAGGETIANYKNEITKNGVVLSDLPKINAFFRRNKVVGGKDNKYVFLIAPEIAAEMQSLKKSGATDDYTFVEINNQQQNQIIYTGQEGKLLSFVFVSTNTIVSDDGYYDCIILGKIKGKWGTAEVDIEGNNKPEMIYKDFGSSGVKDPLNQVASIGWKLKGWGGLVTNEEAVIIYTCKSSLDYAEIDDGGRVGIRNQVVFTEGTGTTATTPTATEKYNGKPKGAEE